MLEFIVKYWVQFAFTIVTGTLTYLVKELYKKIKLEREKEEEELKHMRFGLLSLLHDRIYQGCTFYISKGEISITDLHNMEYLYNGYHALGGNGTCEEIFHRVKKLPIDTKEDVS